jgi:hypothetical protein
VVLNIGAIDPYLVRLIVDAPPGWRALRKRGDHHELRRQKLGKGYRDKTARRIDETLGLDETGAYRSRIGRKEAIDASLAAYDRNYLAFHAATGLTLTRDEYERMLRDGYRFLDRRRPLGHRPPWEDAT